MKKKYNTVRTAVSCLGIFILLCGVLYTGAVTGISGVLFPHQAGGSILEIGGTRYGSTLLGQPFTGQEHLWGRPMNLELISPDGEEGELLLYAGPSNVSPASEEYGQAVRERVKKLRRAHPEMGETPIPVDLVTCSGSGLDPHISPAAAAYQVKRLARETERTEEEIEAIIEQCTDGPFLGIFGEETVNVLEVNLMLDGILGGA